MMKPLHHYAFNSPGINITFQGLLMITSKQGCHDNAMQETRESGDVAPTYS
jgi:hypothetical protein